MNVALLERRPDLKNISRSDYRPEGRSILRPRVYSIAVVDSSGAKNDFKDRVALLTTAVVTFFLRAAGDGVPSGRDRSKHGAKYVSHFNE